MSHGNGQGLSVWSWGDTLLLIYVPGAERQRSMSLCRTEVPLCFMLLG
jgi:hypothetical protein